jgi:hypothetical protein
MADTEVIEEAAPIRGGVFDDGVGAGSCFRPAAGAVTAAAEMLLLA